MLRFIEVAEESDGFIWLGLGANTFTSKDIKDIKKLMKTNDIKFNDTGVNVALNAGLRTNIATNHGLEVAVRMPFLLVATMNESGTKYTLGQTYSILTRYTFNV